LIRRLYLYFSCVIIEENGNYTKKTNYKKFKKKKTHLRYTRIKIIYHNIITKRSETGRGNVSIGGGGIDGDNNDK